MIDVIALERLVWLPHKEEAGHIPYFDCFGDNIATHIKGSLDHFIEQHVTSNMSKYGY